MDDQLPIRRAIEAEQAVIGSMLIDPQCIPDMLDKLTPEDFYDHLNRDIFQTIAAMSDTGQTVDPITIRDKLASGTSTQEESSRYIAQLIEITPTSAHAQAYADIVRESAILRATQEATQAAAKLAGEGAPLSEVQDALQKAQELTAGRQTVKAVTFAETTAKLYRELDERCTSGGKLIGMTSGFKGLDEFTGGLHPGNMIVLAARSGMGKSAIALNIATEAARLTGKLALFFSLEMNTVELTERVYANYADVSLHRIRAASLTDEEWHKLTTASLAGSKLNLQIVEVPALDIAAISRLCRRMQPALVILDHLGLIHTAQRYRDRREAVDALSRSIKCMAKDLHIPVIAVAQLNRAIMSRSNKRPALSDLRESGAIEQDADVVLFVDRPAYYKKDASETAANLIIAKNRHGKTGSVPLLWYGSKQRFIDDWTQGEPTERIPTPSYDADPVQEELPI